MRTALVLTALLLPLGAARADECGPSCPVCSGNSGGVVLQQGTVMISGLVIPLGEEEKAVLNARVGIFDWLDAGVGYTVVERKPLWSLRVEALAERRGGWVPSILVGTGSVRTGSSDQSIYAQLGKTLEITDFWSVSASGGAAMLIPDWGSVFGLAGLTTTLWDRVSLFGSFDGRNFHEGVSVIATDWLVLSAILVESREIAGSVSVKWSFKKKKVDEHDEHDEHDE